MADRVTAPIGIVAGSGLDLIDVLDCKTMEVPFDSMPGLVASGVAGHDGVFIHGAYRGLPVIVQCGRNHFYEGLEYAEVVRPVDVMHDAGVKTIVFTNAAGALLNELQPGDFVAANEIWTWPFDAWPDRPASLALDFQIPDCDAAGRYMWVSGPSYETPAEIALLQRQGGAVVGMSTAPEVHRAQRLGIGTAAVSCVTNVCGSEEPLTHEEVLKTAERASARMRALIQNWIANGAV
jgi:purine-nucleoside phosphorylase